MDIGELRALLTKQHDAALKEHKATKWYNRSPKYGAAIAQIQSDIDNLDLIMARNFGMFYNPDLQIYE